MQTPRRNSSLTDPFDRSCTSPTQQEAPRRVPCSLALVTGQPPQRRAKAAAATPASTDDDSTARRAFRFMLESESLAPFLGTQDLRRLSLCCRDLRPFERQITSLRPRAAHEPASRWWRLIRRWAIFKWRVETLQVVVMRTWMGQGGVTGRALSSAVLRRQAATIEREEGGWDALLDALEAGRVPRLQQLDFRAEKVDHYWRRGLLSGPAVRLGRCLQHVPGLLDLSLEGCHIGSAGAVALAEGLRHTPRLRSLNLFGARIGDEGVVALAAAFPYLPELRLLSLDDCGFRQVGLTALTGQLRHLRELQYLSILEAKWGWVNAASADLFFHELCNLPQLTYLRLSGVWIEDERAIVLASTLPFLPTLQILDLFGVFGDMGGRAIAAALPSLPQLRRLRLCRRGLCKQSFPWIQYAAARQGLVPESDPRTPKGMLKLPRWCASFVRADARSLEYDGGSLHHEESNSCSAPLKLRVAQELGW
jgi:hypothetical protein